MSSEHEGEVLKYKRDTYEPGVLFWLSTEIKCVHHSDLAEWEKGEKKERICSGFDSEPIS